MKKYRIIERTDGYGSKWYCVQKKSIFGWWYNMFPSPYWFGFLFHHDTVWYDSLQKAEVLFKLKTNPTKIRVVKTTENQ